MMENQTITIQKTSKPIKLARAVFGSMLLIGIAASFSGKNGSWPAVLGFVGGIGYLVARIVSWWRHS
jgi:hypothetical protein